MAARISRLRFLIWRYAVWGCAACFLFSARPAFGCVEGEVKTTILLPSQVLLPVGQKTRMTLYFNCKSDFRAFVFDPPGWEPKLRAQLLDDDEPSGSSSNRGVAALTPSGRDGGIVTPPIPGVGAADRDVLMDNESLRGFDFDEGPKVFKDADYPKAYPVPPATASRTS